MLSIRVSEVFATLIGIAMMGEKEWENIVSRKVVVSLSLLQLSKLILKSPMIRIFFFSLNKVVH